MPSLSASALRLAAWFTLLLVASLSSRACLRADRSERCSLDGQRIEPVHQVDLVLAGEVRARFCCVRCASEWPDVPAAARWQVRDELTGAVLDAEKACFVESSVATAASRVCYVHAFGSWVDASNHIAAYGGERVASPLPMGTVSSPPGEQHEDDEER